MPLLRDVPELQFLLLGDLQREIARYTYRPGWELSVFWDTFEGPCLYIVADVPDAFNPGQVTELRIRSNIPPIPSPWYFGVWLQWRLSLIESHEAREFLHCDGRPLFNPHDPQEPGGKESAD